MSIDRRSEQFEKITRNRHKYPFKVLGPQWVKNQEEEKPTWQVVVYRPDADQVTLLLLEQNREYAMRPDHHLGIFVCEIEQVQRPNYLLRLQTIEGEKTIQDPYAYLVEEFSEFDAHLFHEGKHLKLYDKLGSHILEHEGVLGVLFSVWAPNAANVSVIGDFNGWDGRIHQMQLGKSGVWELFIPGLEVGVLYKFEIKNQEGHLYNKTDPNGFQQEVRPQTASVVSNLSTYAWDDQEWMLRRSQTNPLTEPISIYEVHLGSWQFGFSPSNTAQMSEEREIMELSREGNDAVVPLSYRALAEWLIPYVKVMGFTHIELMPITEYPFDGSWGYQVTGYFAATSRYGCPQDLMYFVDQCHQHGIGVILDWVPGHFAKDEHGLAFFDGTHLYEYEDSRKGEHLEWGTLVFDYGKPQVRNFLISSALFWFDKYHIDGIRVDAVASMLYLDYDREDGAWIANENGGREHTEAIQFLRQMNHTLFTEYPGILSIAEESTAWPLVTGPPDTGGLGFNLKWNMGWMHDTLQYCEMNPWFRQYHQNKLTFSLTYAFSENYILALSHDEVVHGKRHLLSKIPGDEWQQFATVRCLLIFMFTHPGKQTLFMGMELGQVHEWDVTQQLDWYLLEQTHHQQLQSFVADLNFFYRDQPSLYSQDFEDGGFEWIDCNDAQQSIISYIRRDSIRDRFLIIICNFTPEVHQQYRIGVPKLGIYQELFNSDDHIYGGSQVGNENWIVAEELSYHYQPYSLCLTLPPLAGIILQWVPEVDE
ncbi:1,4-alpha-glucan branching protein GlgB [Acaryochloris sp. IP29b_bin.137]|uniref:1,4-alpha-glucan branching protein GlgB n=1 Tax=Acaryochloris sp. IP29b_bin.137 TaxID=2969217 RepID=UPI00262A0D49|nr:1,4-alpha-glucan branching protein GlgB [Acaryochloris sp. IP29b_bin.137]